MIHEWTLLVRVNMTLSSWRASFFFLFRTFIPLMYQNSTELHCVTECVHVCLCCAALYDLLYIIENLDWKQLKVAQLLGSQWLELQNDSIWALSKWLSNVILSTVRLFFICKYNLSAVEIQDHGRLLNMAKCFSLDQSIWLIGSDPQVGKLYLCSAFFGKSSLVSQWFSLASSSKLWGKCFHPRSIYSKCAICGLKQKEHHAI